MAYASFQEFDQAVGARKTGVYGHGVDMYTKRDGSGERVFRVKWYERSSKYPTHEDHRRALRKSRSAARIGFTYMVGREYVERSRTFDYDQDGLDAALWWSENVAAPMNAKFQEREDD